MAGKKLPHRKIIKRPYDYRSGCPYGGPIPANWHTSSGFCRLDNCCPYINCKLHIANPTCPCRGNHELLSHGIAPPICYSADSCISQRCWLSPACNSDIIDWYGMRIILPRNYLIDDDTGQLHYTENGLYYELYNHFSEWERTDVPKTESQRGYKIARLDTGIFYRYREFEPDPTFFLHRYKGWIVYPFQPNQICFSDGIKLHWLDAFSKGTSAKHDALIYYFKDHVGIIRGATDETAWSEAHHPSENISFIGSPDQHELYKCDQIELFAGFLSRL